MSEPKFRIGQRVWKHSGRYGGPGRVVAVTIELDSSGYRLYSVEMRIEGGYGTFTHLFPEHLLEDNEAEREGGSE